jgi:hypothetical protein
MLELYVAPQLEEFQPRIISNKMVNLHAGVYMFVGFWMQHFQTVDWEKWSDTLATTVAGYHPPPPLTLFYGGMLRTECFRHQFQILQI